MITFCLFMMMTIMTITGVIAFCILTELENIENAVDTLKFATSTMIKTLDAINGHTSMIQEVELSKRNYNYETRHK